MNKVRGRVGVFAESPGLNLLNLCKPALQAVLPELKVEHLVSMLLAQARAYGAHEFSTDTLVRLGGDTLVRKPRTLWSGRLYL